MKPLTSFRAILASVLAVMVLLSAICSAQPVRAGGGIVLHPPFDGTYRVTAYFDHDDPNYAGDGYNWIYNGERVPATGYPSCTGEPYPYDGHDGWDWGMGEWTDILAAAAGEIVLSEDDWGGYGHTIIISHDNDYHTMYAHLRQRLVQVGNSVTAGQHIGESGDTGSPGSYHLHFGVRHGGYANTTYATDPFGWRGSGRDPLFDYNGKESSCLWAGVPGDDISCADIIVEDDAPDEPYDTWMEWGTWFDSTNGNGYREHHTYSWDYPSSYAYWLPVIPAQGYYQVYAFVPPISSRTTHAEYLVRGIPEETAYRDQSGAAPRWMSLGTFEFAAGYSTNTWVRLHDYTTEPQNSHLVAADAIKFSASIVYLPDVKNSGGWSSSIVIRNNSTSSAQVAINYYNTSGGRIAYGAATIAGNGSVIAVPPFDFSGSAVVVGSEDVLVVVENRKGSGSGLVAEGYSGFPEGETEAHSPTVGNRSSEWSEISVMNADSETSNVTLRFRDRDGYEQGSTQSFSLESNGKRITDLRYVGLPVDFLGSAYITSTKRIVAEATTHFSLSPVNDSAAYEGLATGSTGSLYFPQVKRRMFGGSWYDYSGIVVQNLDENNPAGVYVYFYDRNGVLVTSFSDSIPRKSSHGYNTRYDGQAPPDKMAALGYDFNGSVRVVSSSGREIMGVCKTWIEGGVDAIEMYVGEGGGTSELIVPLVYRKTDNGQQSGQWLAYTGVIVQNLGGSDADVTVHFYRQDGSEVTDASFGDTISPNSPHGYNTRYYGQAPSAKINALGYDFVGSMRIEATNGQPLIGVVDVGLESKAVYYYNAVQR